MTTRIRLDLDQETLRRLAIVAVAERRPIDWQAEVLLRRILGIEPASQPESLSPGGLDGERFPQREIV